MSEPIQHVCTKCGYIASTQYGHFLAERIRTLEAENERLRGQLADKERARQHWKATAELGVTKEDSMRAERNAAKAEVERLREELVAEERYADGWKGEAERLREEIANHSCQTSTAGLMAYWRSRAEQAEARVRELEG